MSSTCCNVFSFSLLFISLIIAWLVVLFFTFLLFFFLDFAEFLGLLCIYFFSLNVAYFCPFFLQRNIQIFKYFFLPIYLSSPMITPGTCAWGCLKRAHISLALCSFLKILFPLFHLGIFYSKSSSPLIRFYAMFNLSSVPFSVRFSSYIVSLIFMRALWISKIEIFRISNFLSMWISFNNFFNVFVC